SGFAAGELPVLSPHTAADDSQRPARRPPFRLTQVRKPGAAIIVAAQALPELRLNVAQFRSTGVSPQMQNAFIKRFNRTYDLMNL
ncbi:hypothetical protein, partial [Priestia megaterium]|uniref:hypothetical protein n=1 Tax=Priestia megaterium TaxID=1404 RepID=UPI00196A919E